MVRKWVDLTGSNSCSGCRICELSCALAYDISTVNPALARIRVNKDEFSGDDTPQTCRQCKKAPCAGACPVAAISFSGEQGAYVVDAACCTGCGNCVQACPFGSIFIHPQLKVALKCELCAGEPGCIRDCPNAVLMLKESLS